MNFPTTQEVKDGTLAKYEQSLGQDSPINDKAFLRVISANQAILIQLLYKFGIERAFQNLAITATGEDLELIGQVYQTPKKKATSAQLQATLPAEDGTIISPVRTFISNLTGIRYNLDAQVVAVGGVATLDLTSQVPGVGGNLEIGQELTIDSPVAGAETIATVTAQTSLGTEEEDEEVYRSRVLDVIRESGGGGNSSSYRKWAQEVDGVKRAYPFSGRPVELLSQSSPPERVVYIEATEDIDPDGIAPQALLDEVRDTITTNPTTGRARQPLGLTNETLYVESIKRTGFYVVVRDLFIDANKEAQAQQNIEDALTLFFKSLAPFVDGLDPDFERNDIITDVNIAGVVDDTLRALGGTAGGVSFGLSLGQFQEVYNLEQGELAKLIQVDFE